MLRVFLIFVFILKHKKPLGKQKQLASYSNWSLQRQKEQKEGASISKTRPKKLRKKKDQNSNQNSGKTTALRHQIAEKRFVDRMSHQARTHTYRGWVGRTGTLSTSTMHSRQFSNSRDTIIVS